MADTVAAMLDGYIQDGSESAISISGMDPANVLIAFEEGWDFDPDVPLSSVRTGVNVWSASAFPVGSGIYTGLPRQPWAVAGNAAGEFYASMIRQDLYPTDNTHTILARSTDGGNSFTNYFEIQRTVKQDRAMFDIDRPGGQGGSSGPFDGSIYLCYDDWGSAGSGYAGSYLEVINADTVTRQVQLSGTSSPPFRGSQFQPEVGTNDGQFFLVSNSVSGGGATVSATFHEFTFGGFTQNFSKSTLSWAPAGQKLGGTMHWGVNGHRIDERGSLAVDRSYGPRRGRLYFITNRNPNPSNPSIDQGDLYLSISVNRGSSWVTAPVPTQGLKTQFFPMIDVDSQGWIHVAFYQNESGYQNSGVLTAGHVDVYYTVSRDGGATWAMPTRVNQVQNFLNMEDPPIGLSSSDYDLLGDYMQLRATGTGDQTAAYVVWTGYDQYRGDDHVGDKKQRVYATRVLAPGVPGAGPGIALGLSAVLAAVGALALARRRRSVSA